MDHKRLWNAGRWAHRWCQSSGVKAIQQLLTGGQPEEQCDSQGESCGGSLSNHKEKGRKAQETRNCALMKELLPTRKKTANVQVADIKGKTL